MRIRFRASDLLSREGFDDGKLLDLLFDLNEFAGDRRRALIEVVRRRVLPALNQKVEAGERDSHNPIRAERVNGEKIRGNGNGLELTPSFVYVNEDDIIAIAREQAGLDIFA